MTDLLVPKTLSAIASVPEPPPEAQIPVTDYLVPDEHVWKLSELNRIDTTSRNVRRWEFIYVNRDGNIAVHIRDMGPVASYSTPELEVWALWEDSWEKCREEADSIRFANTLGVFFGERKGEMTKMVDVWAKWRMELYEQSQNRSHFGPKHKRERNAFVRRK